MKTAADGSMLVSDLEAALAAWKASVADPCLMPVAQRPARRCGTCLEGGKEAPSRLEERRRDLGKEVEDSAVAAVGASMVDSSRWLDRKTDTWPAAVKTCLSARGL